jgi:hypothetical protein
MNGGEEQALELAKEGVKQFFAPVQDVIVRLLGPSATEVGLMWGDVFRVRRLKNALRLFEDVKEVASEAGLRLKPVAPRLLLPILESASLEDEEDLHKRWVALLTNAAIANSPSAVLPAFPDILKQLTSQEAQFLDKAYDEVTTNEENQIASRAPEHRLEPPQPVRIRQTFDFRHPATMITIENLERLMLVSRNTGVHLTAEEQRNTFAAANHLYMTDFGKAFVRSCRIPKRPVRKKSHTAGKKSQ